MQNFDFLGAGANTPCPPPPLATWLPGNSPHKQFNHENIVSIYGKTPQRNPEPPPISTRIMVPETCHKIGGKKSTTRLLFPNKCCEKVFFKSIQIAIILMTINQYCCHPKQITEISQNINVEDCEPVMLLTAHLVLSNKSKRSGE